MADPLSSLQEGSEELQYSTETTESENEETGLTRSLRVAGQYRD